MIPGIRSATLQIFAITAFLAFPITNALAVQGAGRMLYVPPNTTFVENPSGESVVTVNDLSGSISTLQTSINNARSANPNSVLVIRLLPGATYWVTNAGIVLGSRECLVASGATVKASSSSVTVPLIQIASGSTNVSASGSSLDGSGAGINGIYAPAAARVNVDQVSAQNCGSDCILLKGNGNSTYDNEMTVTRCECSGSPAHAGISIQNSTQTAVIDNDCHNNGQGIWLSCAWATVANNTCHHNITDSGVFKITNQRSSFVLAVQSASTNAGAKIIQWTFGSAKNDQWMPVSAGNGFYYFVNRLSGLYLDVPNASTLAGTQLDQQPPTGAANQQFKFWSARIPLPHASIVSAFPQTA